MSGGFNDRGSPGPSGVNSCLLVIVLLLLAALAVTVVVVSR
mgnify:CR=1 FL=1